MARLSKDQKGKVSSFSGVTGEGAAVAQEYLKAVNWNLEAAINRLYSNPAAPAANAASGRKSPAHEAEAFYQQFKASGDENVDAEGIGKLIEALGIDPTDKVLIIFSFYCDAENMGNYTKSEFIRGLLATGCTTLAKFQAKIPALRAELETTNTFTEVYHYTYSFACEEGKRILPLDTACALWQLLFSGRQEWKFTEDWIDFLQQTHKRPVIEDTWKLLLDFRRSNANDFSNFDDSEAWPVLIDEFVEHMQPPESNDD